MALAVTMAAWTAFAPSSGPHTSSLVCRKAVCTQMVTVPEVYESYYLSLPPLQRQLSDTTGPVAQGAMGAVVAGAAAVGYFGLSAVSSRLVVNAVGGAATGAPDPPVVRGRALPEPSQNTHPHVRSPPSPPCYRVGCARPACATRDRELT